MMIGARTFEFYARRLRSPFIRLVTLVKALPRTHATCSPDFHSRFPRISLPIDHFQAKLIFRNSKETALFFKLNFKYDIPDGIRVKLFV